MNVPAHNPGGKTRLRLADGVHGDAMFAGPNECYRLILTRQLLEENRLSPAAQVLAPIAYSFDGRDPEKNFAGKAMAAIHAGDGPGALAILNKQLDKIEGADEES